MKKAGLAPGFRAEHLAITWEPDPGTWDIVATMSGNSFFLLWALTMPLGDPRASLWIIAMDTGRHTELRRWVQRLKIP